MRMKTSFFNKGLFFSNIKRFSWTCILEAVVMFFCFPFNLMILNKSYMWLDHVTDILERRQEYTAFSNLSICLYAVVLAVLLFQYLHQIKMTTALHGLPVSRTELFGSTVLSGAVLLAVPILINTLLVYGVHLTMDIGAKIVMGSVLRWSVYALMLSIVLFAFASFVGMFVGNAAAQFVFTYILHFLPLAVFAAYMALCQMFLFGFNSDFDIPRWIMELPMMTVFHEFTEPCGYYILLFAVLSVVFLTLALFAYKKRPLEQAGDVVVFGWVRPVFKYGVSVCFAVAGFLYVVGVSGMQTQNNLVVNTLLAAVWAAVGFVIAQMLISKSWRIFGALKELGCVCIAVAVGFVILQSDVTGFERRTVLPESVASVTLSGFYEYPNQEVTVSEKDSIELACALHRAVIDGKREAEDGDYGVYMRMEFKLRDGKMFKRAYNVINQPLVLEMYNNDEFVRQGNSILYDDAKHIRSVGTYIDGDKYFINDKDAVLAALRKDVEALDYAAFWENRYVKHDINVYGNAVTVQEKLPESSIVYTLEFEVNSFDEDAYKHGYVDSYIRYHSYQIGADRMPNTHKLLNELYPQMVQE